MVRSYIPGQGRIYAERQAQVSGDKGLIKRQHTNDLESPSKKQLLARGEANEGNLIVFHRKAGRLSIKYCAAARLHSDDIVIAFFRDTVLTKSTPAGGYTFLTRTAARPTRRLSSLRG